MMGKDGNSPNKALNKKIANDELDEKDFQRIIDQKDKTIRKLQFKVQKLQKQKQDLLKLSSGQGHSNNYYKQLLENEIKQSNKTIQLLINLSQRMLKLIQLLNNPLDLSQDCSQVKNLIKLIGDGNESISRFGNDDNQDYSNIQTLEAASNEAIKRIEDLESVCDLYHKSFTKIHKQHSGMEKRINDIKKQSQEQIRTMKKEVKQSRTAKQQLSILLQKNEQQKKDLLASIANSFDSKTKKQLQKMNKDELLDFIKKLGYKINELEASKNQIIKQNKKIKTADLEKYKKILHEVKQVKQMSRIGQSMM